MVSHIYICTPNKTGTVLEVKMGGGNLKTASPRKKYLVVSKRFLPLHSETKKGKPFELGERKKLLLKIFESMGNNNTSFIWW